jgi:TPR repeat protein
MTKSKTLTGIVAVFIAALTAIMFFHNKIGDYLYQQATADRSLETPAMESRAVNMLKVSAWLGNADSMAALALAYANGDGTPVNLAISADWSARAAAGGNSDGMEYLGEDFLAGRGVDVDKAKAFGWFEKAAEAGNSAAEFNIGVLYAEGNIVTKDHVQSAYWLTKAVDAGSTKALLNLANDYANGDGVKKDNTRAFQLYLKAADLAHSPTAAFNVGMTYFGRGLTGVSVPNDSQKGLYYLKMSANGGLMPAILAMAEYAKDTEHDSEKYKDYMEKAADTGYKPALFVVSCLLLHKGIPEEDVPLSETSSDDLARARQYLATLRKSDRLSNDENEFINELESRLEFFSMRSGENVK